MQFSQIINQKKVKAQFVELVQQNRLSHALLLLGKEGNGALALALGLAQYITCEKVNGPRSTDPSQQLSPSLFEDIVADSQLPASDLLIDSCGNCPSCYKAQQLIHPDIHFSFPVVIKKSGSPPVSKDYIINWREFIKANPYGNVFEWLQYIGAENKQGNITAQECSDIISIMNLKSFESGYKILILWMPEYLGNEGNKLLKLMEEPPPDTLFILVTHNENLILPTIVSRCQLIKIPALDAKDIEEALISLGNTDAATAKQIAALCEGNYNEAIQLMTDAENGPVVTLWQAMIRDWLNAILKTGPLAQAKWVEEISGLGREKQKQFLRYFNHLLGQAIRLRIAPSQPSPKGKESDSGIKSYSFVIAEAEKDFAERLNKIAGIEQQQAIIEELDRATYYIERNAHAKILFHALSIKIYHIIKDKIVFLVG